MTTLNALRREFGRSAWDTAPEDDPSLGAAGDDVSSDDWSSVAHGLNQYYPGTIDETFETRVAEANSSAALAVLFGQSSDQPLSITAHDYLGSAPAAAPGGTTVRAFWWGFHVQFSHEDLQWVLDSADLVNNAVVAIGGSIPSPAQPWIRLIGPFVSLVHQKLRELDEGNGIYISMSWFAPGLFVPTRV